MKWVMVLFILGAPLLVGILMKCDWFSFAAGTSEGWLGFWGGYLGSLLSIFGALWIFNKQSSKDKQEINDTLKAQMKITSTFTYYEYLLAENKELISTIQKTSDDLYDYYKIAKDIEFNPIFKEKVKMNPVHGELQRDFNSMFAITSVLYREYREDIDILQDNISDRFGQWHTSMVEYKEGDDLNIDAQKRDIQTRLNILRTEVAKESRLLIVKMKAYMNEEESR
ncbi:hypothetical protein [Listeria booriae]|uniref:hypothetical protein n=1 Tax=Listeria booriae TaxID=1552123 RepID=UPI00163DA6AC|nr:hypothetical protein [Listeria booriae]MBC1307911.1 hypothetical protein [Listeria booriae]